MPEFRQNLATKEWVIIATERAVKPESLRAKSKPPAVAEKSAQCALCPGGEKKAPKPAWTLGEGAAWRVRVYPSPEPALVRGAAASQAPGRLYRTLPGEGVHELIVDGPRHDKEAALLDKGAMADLVTAYKERFDASLTNDRVALTLIMKNRAAAGEGQHPHSELLGSSVVPAYVRHRMDEAEKYFQQESACVFCRMMEEERRQGSRIIAETGHFVAFIPFAALSPFHIWVLPKRHIPSFGGATPKELEDFAAVLRSLLVKVHAGLGDPGYNYVILSAPLDRGTTEAYHWYLSLVPKVVAGPGLEMGSGIFLNLVIPEEAARFLNSVKA